MISKKQFFQIRCKSLSKWVRSILYRGNPFLFGYLISSCSILILLVALQYYRYNIFGTRLLLGWDSPAYVWVANQVIAKGPMIMIQGWSYPHLYVQLLAFLGYLSGDVVIVERILPLVFCTLLIGANSAIVFKIGKNVHIAGLAAFLTVASLNVLRLLADLNRNLMAFSMSMIVLMLVPSLDDKESFLNKRYLSFILILFVIAGTQFETYFVLSLCLVLYGLLTRKIKKLLMLTFACAVPVAILLSLFPAYFFGYMSTIVVFPMHELTFDQIFLWGGGSWILLGFLILTTYFFYRSRLRKDELAKLVFSWCFVIILIVVLIGLRVIPFTSDFATRALLIMPISVLLALAISACNEFIKSSHFKIASSPKKYSIRVAFRPLLLSILAFSLTATSIFVAFQHYNEFLTPYIPRSSYEKILETKAFLAKNDLSNPVFVFYGYPAYWFANIYRNYVGAELSEHFAYYGEIENLFRFIRSEPESSDPSISEMENYYSTFFYNELIGNWSGPPPPMYVHDSHITNVTELMSHPIVIITPEFYNQQIPYCIKQFHVGDGTYVIPPNSQIDFSKVSYGPEITVIRDNTTSKINSTYLYIDPKDPSIVYLSVNASHGYTSYNLTNIPSDWNFAWIEQGGDTSFPERDPRRVNGTLALVGNDPTESLENWSTPWPEQDASLEIDKSSKKEGFASLKITGKTDKWGNLGVTYNLNGTWDLSKYSSISVWAKSNQSALFFISLMDANGNSRTFWSIKAREDSATTSWKRFAVNLSDYTSQTDGFNLSMVDTVNFYVWDSNTGKPISFWIDDLTVDTSVALEKTIYKDRVPVDETVVAYFYTRIEDK